MNPIATREVQRVAEGFERTGTEPDDLAVDHELARRSKRAPAGREDDVQWSRSSRGRDENQKDERAGQTPAHARRMSPCGLPETATVSAIALKSPWTIIPG